MPNLSIHRYRITGQDNFHIRDFDTADTNGYRDKQEAQKRLSDNVVRMAELQDKFYAQDRESLLIIFQAMDTAGKDGAIKHVMSGLNPQGVQVVGFKQPSIEELDHDYFWRYHRALPARGNIGIFNRSYYEEVLVSKVHNLPATQKLPDRCFDGRLWEQRYRQISDFERYLYENGTTVLKFFLHLSPEEQKERLLSRIDDKTKNWKFSAADIAERAHWDDYMDAYEEAINATSCKTAPWYIIPADKKWFARLLISEIIIQQLKKLNPSYPAVSEEQERLIEQSRKKLEDKSSESEKE